MEAEVRVVLLQVDGGQRSQLPTKGQEGAWPGVFLTASGGTALSDSNLQNLETGNFCHLSCPVLALC